MGDTGYVDTERFIWLVGRVHSTIYRDGRAVHPQLVEQAGAAASAAIVRIAAVGLPDSSLGERVVVIVETTAGEEILAQVRDSIEEAELPVDEVRIAAIALPLDPRHRSKIDYPALHEHLLKS
jgi:fatty-acyl-CoA synthase